MARVIWDRFLSKCDIGLDFHTSTRNRMTILHGRADMEDEGIQELAEALGAPLILSGQGSSGMLRRVATENGTPTITIEMGEANRFQSVLISAGLMAVDNVLDAYEMYPDATPNRAPFTRVLTTEEQKTWVRADNGGLVEMKWGPLPVVEEGETICVISDYFKREEHIVTAPFDGFLVGILANPRVQPGHPLVHLVEIQDEDREEIQRIYEQFGFLHHGIFHWMGRMGEQMADTYLESRLEQRDEDG